MKEIKAEVKEKSFSKEGGFISFEIKAFQIQVDITLEEVETEYEQADYEDGFCKYAGGDVVKSVTTYEEILCDDEHDNYYDCEADDFSSRDVFQQKAGLTDRELEIIEKTLKETAHQIFEGWACDNPDEVL